MIVSPNASWGLLLVAPRSLCSSAHLWFGARAAGFLTSLHSPAHQPFLPGLVPEPGPWQDPVSLVFVLSWRLLHLSRWNWFALGEPSETDPVSAICWAHQDIQTPPTQFQEFLPGGHQTLLTFDKIQNSNPSPFILSVSCFICPWRVWASDPADQLQPPSWDCN